MKSKKLKNIMISITTLVLILLFQNCGVNSFHTRMSDGLSLTSNSISDQLNLPSENLPPDDVIEPPEVIATTGNIYYVSTAGRDTSDSCSNADPCRTIMEAYSKTIPGDTVIVKPGVYTDYKPDAGNLLNHSGNSTKPIVVMSETRNGAVIDFQNQPDSKFGFWVSGSYNTIRGFEIRNAYNGGIEVSGSNNKFIENEIHNNGNKMSLSSPYGQDGISGSGSDLVIDKNYIHHNGRVGSNADHGLYLHGDNIWITNNVITHNATSGIQILGDATVSNMKIYNNTVAFNLRVGILLNKKMDGLEIKNNIIYKNNLGINFYYVTGSGIVLENNIFYGNLTVKSVIPAGLAMSGTDPILLDPLFINENSNYRVQSGPAIDQGVAVPVLYDHDRKSRARGKAIDIGAFEY